MKARLTIIIICSAILFSSCSGKGTAKQSDNYRNYYEIFVRSFYDSDGDGIGDLKGVTSKLDYISKDLGADGIWLMPIMPSPSYHKYNVTNYYAIDPQYGTMDDFDELMQETDKRDIKVIIDLVVNHTSDMMPWFRKAVEGLWDEEENEYTRYYNFTTEYSGSGYTKLRLNITMRRVFTDMPDLNLDNERSFRNFEYRKILDRSWCGWLQA